jgi:hypothetical protein
MSWTFTALVLLPYAFIQFDVQVKVTDPTSLFDTATYTINVLNSNDPPVLGDVTVNIDILNVAPSVELVTLLATDADGTHYTADTAGTPLLLPCAF